jgi:hypothetical protein
MKKNLLIASAVFFVITAFGQTNLPNGDFEQWRSVQGIDSVYWVPTGDFFQTLDTLANLPSLGGSPGPITAYRTTDAYSGTYAVKLVSNTFPWSPQNIFIPGMLGTTQMNILGNSIFLGKPCPGPDCRPLKLRGFYKYMPVSTDAGEALICVTRYNTSTHKKDTIGSGKMIYKNLQTTYDSIVVPISYNYPASAETPDSMTILVVASAGFRVDSLTSGKGFIGSTMIVDDLSLEYPLGIQQMLMPEVTVKTYPDPAKDLLTVELSEKVKNGTFEVYTLQGQNLNRIALSEKVTEVPVQNLPNATYYFKLTDGKNVINTGFFVIQR